MSEREQLPMFYRRPFDEGRAATLNQAVRDLREGGVSYASIATVLGLYEGVLLSASEVRSWCGRLGLPVNPNKTRPPRAVAA